MKLILLPLSFLMVISLLSMMGLGSIAAGTDYSVYPAGADYTATVDGWYDVNGHLVRYANGTNAGEKGIIGYEGMQRYWGNDTNLGVGWDNTQGQVREVTHENKVMFPVFDLWEGQHISEHTVSQIMFNVESSYGFIALIVGLMALAAIVGLRVFGTGTSELSVSTIVIGTGLISLWAVFSITSMTLIVAIPLVGPIFYFFLTALYTLGIIGRVGGGGGTE